jgi:hypothetical protein
VQEGHVTETHPPSWLPDPFGRYQYRYWDGTEWTNMVSTNGSQESDPHGLAPSVNARPTPAAVESSGPRTKPAWSTQVQALVFGGAALIVVGSLMPWVKASAGVFSATKNGIDGDGVLTLGLAAAIALGFFFSRQAKTSAWLVIAPAGIVLAIAIYDMIDISNKADELTNSRSLIHVSATIGAGLWLTVVAGVVALLGGLLALNQSAQQ